MEDVAGGQAMVDGHNKARKPYTITKQRERWTDEEHAKFLEALRLFGRAWRKIEEYIGTKSAVQIRSHAQKFFSKVERKKETGIADAGGGSDPFSIPPPRPKRKPARPYPKKEADDNSGGSGDGSGNNLPPIFAMQSHQQQQQTGVATSDPAQSYGALCGGTLQEQSVYHHHGLRNTAALGSCFAGGSNGVLHSAQAPASLAHATSCDFGMQRLPQPPQASSGLYSATAAMSGGSALMLSQSDAALMLSMGMGSLGYSGLGSAASLPAPSRLQPPPPPSLGQHHHSQQSHGQALHPYSSLGAPSAMGSQRPAVSDGCGMSSSVNEATVAAVAAAASAAAAAAAAAVVAAAGQQVQAHLQSNPPMGFPFFGVPPSLLAQVTLRNPALEVFTKGQRGSALHQWMHGHEQAPSLSLTQHQQQHGSGELFEGAATTDCSDAVGESDSRNSDGDSANACASEQGGNGAVVAKAEADEGVIGADNMLLQPPSTAQAGSTGAAALPLHLSAAQAAVLSQQLLQHQHEQATVQTLAAGTLGAWMPRFAGGGGGATTAAWPVPTAGPWSAVGLDPQVAAQLWQSLGVHDGLKESHGFQAGATAATMASLVQQQKDAWLASQNTATSSGSGGIIGSRARKASAVVGHGIPAAKEVAAGRKDAKDGREHKKVAPALLADRGESPGHADSHQQLDSAALPPAHAPALAAGMPAGASRGHIRVGSDETHDSQDTGGPLKKHKGLSAEDTMREAQGSNPSNQGNGSSGAGSGGGSQELGAAGGNGTGSSGAGNGDSNMGKGSSGNDNGQSIDHGHHSIKDSTNASGVGPGTGSVEASYHHGHLAHGHHHHSHHARNYAHHGKAQGSSKPAYDLQRYPQHHESQDGHGTGASGVGSKQVSAVQQGHGVDANLAAAGAAGEQQTSQAGTSAQQQAAAAAAAGVVSPWGAHHQAHVQIAGGQHASHSSAVHGGTRAMPPPVTSAQQQAAYAGMSDNGALQAMLQALQAQAQLNPHMIQQMLESQGFSRYNPAAAAAAAVAAAAAGPAGGGSASTVGSNGGFASVAGASAFGAAAGQLRSQSPATLALQQHQRYTSMQLALQRQEQQGRSVGPLPAHHLGTTASLLPAPSAASAAVGVSASTTVSLGGSVAAAPGGALGSCALGTGLGLSLPAAAADDIIMRSIPLQQQRSSSCVLSDRQVAMFGNTHSGGLLGAGSSSAVQASNASVLPWKRSASCSTHLSAPGSPAAKRVASRTEHVVVSGR